TLHLTLPPLCYTLSLHDALPISRRRLRLQSVPHRSGVRVLPVRAYDRGRGGHVGALDLLSEVPRPLWPDHRRGGDRADRRRLPRSEEHTSELSHQIISYAVFCLK